MDRVVHTSGRDIDNNRMNHDNKQINKDFVYTFRFHMTNDNVITTTNVKEKIKSCFESILNYNSTASDSPIIHHHHMVVELIVYL